MSIVKTQKRKKELQIINKTINNKMNKTGKTKSPADYPIWMNLDVSEFMVKNNIKSEAELFAIVRTLPPPFCWGGGDEPPTKFSKRGSSTRPQLLEGGCWERVGDFFQGGLQFLESEIFNDKKKFINKNILFYHR